MSANAFILSNQVIMQNEQFFTFPNPPISKMIPVDNTEIVGAFWRIPIKLGNRVLYYNAILAPNTTSLPVPDAFKVLRLKTQTAGAGEVIEIAILNTDEVETTHTFATYADGLGGSLPTMPSVTIPLPILEIGPSSSIPGVSNTFTIPLPNNPSLAVYGSGLVYSIPNPTFNGLPASPTYTASVTTPATLASWINIIWGTAYSLTATASGNILKIVCTLSGGIIVKTMGLDAYLTPHNQCINLTACASTPSVVNGFKIGSGSIIPIPGFVLDLTGSDAGINILIAELTKALPQAIYTGPGTAHKLTVKSIYDSIGIYNNTTLVGTAGIFGAC